jgi:stage II sporulation protein M
MIKQLLRSYRDLVRANQRWVRIALWTAIAGFVVGLVIMAIDAQLVLDQLKAVLDKLISLGSDVQQANWFDRTVLIFENNIIAGAIMMFFGFIAGIFPWNALFGNGMLMGVVTYLTITSSGSVRDLLVLGVGLVPHGIFEIPALLIAGGFGMKLGIAWLLPSAKGKRKKVLNDTVLECVQIFGLLVILFFVAACIEANISLPLTELLTS